MCQICPWWQSCDKLWHDEDRLNLVAGLGRGHRNELEKRGIDTVVGLAQLGEPLPFRPDHGSREAYLASAHQAQMQVQTRRQEPVAFELLPVETGFGLTRLPAPSERDVFLDLEGHPFFGLSGLEYLWGWSDAAGEYQHVWALDPIAEKRALEAFVHHVIDLRARHPEMHVYHYGAYEESAIKRLATRHATHEDDLDVLLRVNVFVDLASITRQAARIGVESYSLKDLERVHGYVREADLRSVSPHKRALEHGLILGTLADVPDLSCDVVRTYNRDDVVSTIYLRDWLEGQRAESIGRGMAVPRPDAAPGDPSDSVEEQRREATEVIEALQAELPEDPDAWTEEHEALSLLKCGWFPFNASR